MSILSAPLIAVTDPGTAEESVFQSSKDNLTFYLKRWLPTQSASIPPRANVVFVHGFIEHYGRYDNIFPVFAQSNISVTAFDQRGFGRTWTKHENPKKAHGNTTWKQQLEDIEDLIRLERARLDEKYGKDKVPIYLMGHSMGGGLAFAFFTRPTGEDGPSQEVKAMVKGVLLSSPWIKLTNPPPGWLVWLAPRVLHYFPNCPYIAGVSPKEISSDEAVQKWTAADPFCDGHVYLKCLPGPLLGGVKLYDEDYKNWPEDTSLLIMHGSADPVCSCVASKELVEKTTVKDKEHKEWEGLLHECWHEKGDIKLQVINHLVDWIKARTPEAS